MKKLPSLLMTLLAMFLVSCENDDFNQKKTTNSNEFSLSYSILNPVSAVTRSNIEVVEGEDNINSFYLLFFESTSGGNGLFIEAIDAISPQQHSLGTSGNLTITFPENSQLNNSSDYKILFCANIEEYVSFPIESVSDINNQFAGNTENEVISTFMQITGVPSGLSPDAEQADDSHKMSINNLPMSAKAFKSAGETNLSVELARVVSRFDVFCQARGYELVSASVWNAMTVSPIWEGLHRDYSDERTERYYGVKANNQGEIAGSLYSFENYVSKPQQHDKKTTCLIIGLKNEDSGQIEYFRANISADYLGQSLKRNNVYRSTIRSVNAQGADNERDAYENPQLLIDLDINGWTLDDWGNIHHNGDDILAIPTQTITLASYGETREYTIFTLGEGTLEMYQTNIPDHIQVELNKNHLTITAAASTETFTDGLLTFVFNEMSGTIRIEQMQHVGDFIELNISDMLVFGNNSGEVSPEIQVTSSGPWTAKIYNGNYFSFEEGSLLQEIHGESEDFLRLHTLLANSGMDARYSYLLVKLDSRDDVSRMVQLEQGEYEGLIDVAYQSMVHNYWGSLTDDHCSYRTNHFQQFYQVYNDPKLFGPHTEVKVRQVYALSSVQSMTGSKYIPSESATILINNLVNYKADEVKKWLQAKPTRVLLELGDLSCSTFMKALALPDYGSSVGVNSAGLSYTNARRINGVSKSGIVYTPDNNALYDYLFRSGPFGSVDQDDIWLVPYDGASGSLKYSECPPTMIPLIMDLTKERILLGVDPTNRFVFAGELELFGNKGGAYTITKDGVKYKTAHNYSADSPHGPANTILLNNLMAWMINVNKFGETFTRQFID